jgi:hypothetical protein
MPLAAGSTGADPNPVPDTVRAVPGIVELLDLLVVVLEGDARKHSEVGDWRGAAVFTLEHVGDTAHVVG